MSATPPPLPVHIDRKPIIYSALIYPGVGQYMMGRQVVGIAFAVCFTIALVIFLVFFARYFRETLDFVRAWWTDTYQLEDGTPSPRQLMMPFVYMAITYLANVYDVTWRLYRPHLENRAKAQTTNQP